MIRRLKRELNRELKRELKDKFQEVYDDLLGETCGTPQACMGNVFVGTTARTTANANAEYQYVGPADSMNDCAFKVWDWLQYHKTATVNGATFRLDGNCYAASKMDPVATADNAARKKFSEISSSACLIRGPCQHLHVGDLAGAHEEYYGDVESADITDCAWRVAWRNEGANGATLHGRRCYAEFGADPYSVGFTNHAEHIHRGHTSCMLWEAQDEKIKKKRRNKCRGDRCGRGRKNKKSRRGRAGVELQKVVKQELAPSTDPASKTITSAPLATAKQATAGKLNPVAIKADSLPSALAHRVAQQPAAQQPAPHPGRRLMGGGHGRSRKRKGYKNAANGMCMWAVLNDMMNPCKPVPESDQNVINHKLGFMYGDIFTVDPEHNVGKAVSLSDCANQVSTWDGQDGRYTGVTWYQPDPARAEGDCWAKISFSVTLPPGGVIVPEESLALTSESHKMERLAKQAAKAVRRQVKKYHRWRPSASAPPPPITRNIARNGSKKHQSCIIDLNTNADMVYPRKVGLVAPQFSSCSSQGWQAPRNQNECKVACDALSFSGSWLVANWWYTTPGCFVTENADGSYGNCHWNTCTNCQLNTMHPLHRALCKNGGN